MVRTRVFSLLCLGFLLILAPGRLPGNPPADEDSALRNWLALQRAMENARFLMLAGDTKKAVDVLEEQLPRVNEQVCALLLGDILPLGRRWVDFSKLKSYPEMDMSTLHLHHGHHHHHATSVLAAVSSVAK